MSALERLRGHVVDLTPLRRSREFRLLFLGMAVSDLGNELTFVTMPFQVYAITRSTLAVGLLGVCDLVPLLFAPVIGGMIADTVERRRMVLWLNGILTLVSIGLAANALLPQPKLWPIYAGATVSASLHGFYSPAVRAWPARLFDKELLPSAFALTSAFYSLDALVGPAIAGVLIAWIEPAGVYLVDVATFFVALVALGAMRPSPPAEEAPPASWAAIKEGLRFLKGKHVLQSTYLIDLNAMIFGMPTALFPAVAQDLLHVGPAGLGLLYAAPAAGSLLASVLSGGLKRVRRQGRAILLAVTVWGAAIVVFGVSRALWLSLVFLAIAGAGDMVSGVFRTTIAQSVVSDEMRGRLEGMGLTVWASGPALGNVESGVVASIFTVPISIVSGGLLCIAGVGVIATLVPRFRRYDARHPHA
jgi:MFS family permease